MRVRVSLDWNIEVPDDPNVALDEQVQQYMRARLSWPLGKILVHMIVTDMQQIYPWEE